MDNKQQESNMVYALQLGDLVRHKHLGGLGIITGTKQHHSNITMGQSEWFVVKWITIGAIQRKAGAHVDRKKERNKRACRSKVQEWIQTDNFWPWLFLSTWYITNINNETWRLNDTNRHTLKGDMLPNQSTFHGYGTHQDTETIRIKCSNHRRL